MILIDIHKDILLNGAIYTVTVLFILSLITERITHFLKLSLGEVNSFWTGKRLRLRTKTANLESENSRERNILIISVITGTCVALSLKADLFSILSSKGGADLFGWDKFDLDISLRGAIKLAEIVLGCIATGFFISVGSKFWHDLLDTLLEVKNLKRKLNDTDTYNNSDINSFDAYLKLNESDIIDKILTTYKSLIWQHDSVISSEIRFINSKHTLFIATSDGSTIPSIGSEIRYEFFKDNFKTVPVVYQQVSPVKIHSDLYPSYNITFQADVNNSWGSISGFVKKIGFKENYILTCYHVVKPPNQRWDKFVNQNDGSEIVKWVDDDQIKINNLGIITEGFRDDLFDVALVKITDPTVVPKNALFNIGPLGKTRYIEGTDLEASSTVVMYGGKSNFRRGRIVGYKSDVKINYGTNDDPVFSQLIAIQSVDDSPFSDGGDSGSIIYDLNTDSAIGMLIGGNLTTSYAIPLPLIFNKLSLTFIK